MVRALPLALLAVPVVSRDAVTPLEKVLEMMNGMLSKGKAEKHEEEVEFTKFKSWCDNTRDETTTAIKDSADQIVQLTASIDKNTADAEQLTEEVKELEALINTNTDELKAATEIRNKENAEYKATHADLSESIDAIERASSVLKSKMARFRRALPSSR